MRYIYLKVFHKFRETGLIECYTNRHGLMSIRLNSNFRNDSE